MDQQESKKQTIALCMIVKDEEQVVLRALRSVSKIIDYFCICDTGSSDNTVEVIEQYLKDNNLSGTVHRRPWVSFSHNRSECFNLASGKCDYLMTLDADEVFAPLTESGPDDKKIIKRLPQLLNDQYYVKTWCPGMEWYRLQFFKDGLDWKWVCPVHEVCVSDKLKTSGKLRECCIMPFRDGARAKDSNRFLWDAFAFERALKETPEDARMWFYLAQSYHDAGRIENALEGYQTCIDKSKWAEQNSVAYLRMARIIAKKHGFDEALPYFWKSYEAKPQRGEALYEILAHYRREGSFHSAVAAGEAFLKCDVSKCILFLETAIYKWKAKDELSLALYYVGRKKEAYDMVASIVDVDSIPEGDRERLRKNMEFMKG